MDADDPDRLFRLLSLSAPENLRTSIHYFVTNFTDKQTNQQRTNRHICKREVASTHHSAMTHDGTAFVSRDLDLRPFDPKINYYLGRIVGHLYIQFGYPSYIGFSDIMRINRQTDKRR